MCQLVLKDIESGDEQVKADAIRIGQYTDGQYPTESKEFAKRIFYTVYMGSENSSEATRMRAKMLADEIGSWHHNVSIDTVVSSLISLFQTLTGKRPRYKPADINPIGSISKQDLRAFLHWAANHIGYPSLAEVEAAPPTAELEPIRTNYSQLDEVDMGMTYEELSVYGRMRKIFRCGPVSMFKNLCYKWGSKLAPTEVSDKVKHFFKYYSINQHKMTVLTPSYHAESYSPEDNKFDLRQFVYNAKWSYQFRKIDDLVQQLNDSQASIPDHGAAALQATEGGGVVGAGSGDPKAGL